MKPASVFGLLVLLAAVFAADGYSEVVPRGEKLHRLRPHDLYRGPQRMAETIPGTLQENPARPSFSLDDWPNIRINSDQTVNVQNEEMACISPLDSNIMVAVWRDFRLGYRRVGVGYSHDGGETWTDALFPVMFYTHQSDPVLIVDAEGVFSAMMIAYDRNEPNGEDGLLQVSSYDGGVTWRDSVFAANAVQPPGFEDKEMLTADISGSIYHGSRYCVWAHFYGEGDVYDSTHIWLTYQRPGELYSDPVVISSVTSNQWPNVAVGAEGEVYVSWGSYAHGGLKFARSTDGGQTFTEEQFLRSMRFVGANVNPDLLIFSYGVMATDVTDGLHRGRLYMVYTDALPDYSETDIFFMYSDDHGDNWTTPVRLNDDDVPYAADQFHPWLTVDERGRVWAAFYDRRNDPDNLLMDVYFTVSIDGGETWRANQRITSVSCDPGAGSLDAGLIGEYIGWHACHDKALAVWTDTRLGNQDIFTTVIDSLFIDDAADEILPVVPRRLSLAAYPNPTNSRVNLTYTVPSPGKTELTVYNTLGRTVHRSQLDARAGGEHTASLDMSGFSSGLYLAVLSARGESAAAKILLVR